MAEGMLVDPQSWRRVAAAVRAVESAGGGKPAPAASGRGNPNVDQYRFFKISDNYGEGHYAVRLQEWTGVFSDISDENNPLYDRDLDAYDVNLFAFANAGTIVSGWWQWVMGVWMLFIDCGVNDSGGLHDLLGELHQDTVVHTVQDGDLIFGNGTAWDALPIGTTGALMRVSGAGQPAWWDGSLNGAAGYVAWLKAGGATSVSGLAGDLIGFDENADAAPVSAVGGVSIVGRDDTHGTHFSAAPASSDGAIPIGVGVAVPTLGWLEKPTTAGIMANHQDGAAPSVQWREVPTNGHGIVVGKASPANTVDFWQPPVPAWSFVTFNATNEVEQFIPGDTGTVLTSAGIGEMPTWSTPDGCKANVNAGVVYGDGSAQQVITAAAGHLKYSAANGYEWDPSVWALEEHDHDADYAALAHDHDAAYPLKDSFLDLATVQAIVAADVTAWNSKAAGDHNHDETYLKIEAFNAEPCATIGSQDIENWNDAYGWGDHSQAGYLTAQNAQTLSGIELSNGNLVLSSTPGAFVECVEY